MKHTDSELFCRGVAAQSGGLEFGIGSRRPNGLSRVWEAPPPAEPGFGSLSLAMTASSSAGRGVRPCSAPQARRGKAQGVGRPWGASGFQSSRLTGLLTQQPKAASVGTAGKLSSNSNAVSLVSKRDSSLGIEKTRASGASLFFPDPLAVPAAPPAQRGRPDGVVFWRSAIIWFRSDLRLHDNEALSTAFREASSVVPVYCFDPREFGRSQTGFHQTGAYK